MKRLRKSLQSKRLANESVDQRRMQGSGYRFLAVSTGQDYFHLITDSRGFIDYLTAGGSGNSYVQQQRIDVVAMSTNQLNRRRPIRSFEYLEPSLAKHFRHGFPERIFIINNQHGGVLDRA